MTRLVLTKRQIQVLQLMANGMVAKVIAHDLGLHPDTVMAHYALARKNNKMRTNIDLLLCAIAQGLVTNPHAEKASDSDTQASAG